MLLLDGLEETCQELIKRVLAEKERKRREQEINEQIQLDIINEHKRKYEGEKLGLDQAVIAARQWQDRKNLLEQFVCGDGVSKVQFLLFCNRCLNWT
jgi:hypothetical protein